MLTAIEMQWLYLPRCRVPPQGRPLALDEPPVLRVSLPHGGRALLVEVVQVGTHPELEAAGTRLQGIVCTKGPNYTGVQRTLDDHV